MSSAQPNPVSAWSFTSAEYQRWTTARVLNKIRAASERSPINSGLTPM